MLHATRPRLNEFGRSLIVERVLVQGRPVSPVAKELGVSRQCAHRWVRRFLAEGGTGLTDHSSRPLRSPRRTPEEVGGRVRPVDRGGDPLLEEHRIPLRTRDPRRAGAHGCEESGEFRVLAERVLLVPSPVGAQLGLDEVAQLAQVGVIDGGGLARRRVVHAQRSDLLTARRLDRNASIEPHSGIAFDTG